MSQTVQDDDPHDPRRLIPYVEFYITNVCNLTCTNCNRFNDHKFAGWQDWKQFEDQYQKWSQHVRLQRITILGGEPLLNPTICDWVTGINQIFQKPVQVLSNGTRLNHVPGLYDVINVNSDPKYPWVKNWIGLSLHNARDRSRMFDEVHGFLKGPVSYHHRSDSNNVNNCFTHGADHAFVDSNGVAVRVWEYDSFYRSAVHRNSQGRLTVYNSDPVLAHGACGFVMYKCYHFIRAKLYKCGPVALLPEFDQQHNLDISQQDRDLMNSYHALSVDEFPTQGHKFLDHIDDVIPQCKFCPVDQINQTLFAVSKRTGSTSTFD
jgi:hypothetical protein